MKTKIAAIGEKDIMLIFKAVGADVLLCMIIEQAAASLKKIAKEDYGIIFITETIAEKLDALIMQYSDMVKPSIVVIPGLGKRNNYAVSILRNAIIKASGTDIFS
ncbi:MAG: V-type ATP synthase subunit F [Actinobacteria bacterium]|nr:V-type ATP synthase subunit F [Actinomycetota bacterium]